MKAQILKHTGLTEKQFYAKYKTQKDFENSKEGKAFKKAKTGMEISKAQLGTSLLPDSNQNGIPDYLENIQPINNTYTGQGSVNRQFGSGIGNYNFGPQNNPNPVRNTLPNAPIAQEEIYNPSMQSGLSTYSFTAQDNITKNQGITGGMPTGDVSKAAGAAGGINSYMGAATDIIGGIQGLSKQKEEKNKARQARKVTDIQALASGTREEESERRYNTPWDNPVQANQMFPTYGVGTNVITRNGGSIQRAQYGTQISGNPTEIQNTYAPNDIYDDGGYEPLNDSNIKQYYDGGYIQQAQDGMSFANIMGEQGGAQGIASIGSMFSNGSAESQIGKGLGTAAGAATGIPGADILGGAFGSAVGGLFNTSQGAIKRDTRGINRNIGTMVGNATGQGLQAQYSSYVKNGGDIPSYEEGGYMNPEYNPQVITMFGDHNAQDFADYAHKDQYRAGGHLKSYTPPSDRAMETYENGGDIKSHGLGGELQTHWGGGAETISRNPYLPGTGETVMFRGKSHEEYSPNGETGIGVTYGGNPVEVERGEPMVELEEGGTVDPQTGEVQKSGVVFGNLKIPNQYIDLLGDPNAKDKKFKTYVGVDLYKQEKKGTRLVEEGTAMANKKNVTPLELNVARAKIFGGNSMLKTAADRKINAASLQNAINDTAEENGLVADDLARGKVKIDKEAQSQYAKFGGSFTKAQDGKKTIKGRGDKWDYTTIGANQTNPQWQTEEAYNTQWSPKVDKALDDSERAKKILNYIKTYKGPNASKVQAALNKFPTEKAQLDYLRAHAKDREISDMHYLMDAGIQSTEPAETKPAETKPATETKKEEEKIYPIEATKRNPWIDAASQILPYFRPSDQEGLDMAQLYPEMFAMATNQLEPVPAQGYRPDLGTPYDISFQDQLNANQADYNASQRMVGYNPAAQSSLNAQKYQANQQVLGSQFRANQEMKDKVYGENRNILNQAKLQNLEIFDRQYGRQSEAKSNTKATTQAALNSISDKYAKNKLENRTLGVMENMYNYRYDNQGRAVNMNAPWQPNVPTVYNKGDQTANMKAVYDQQGKFIRWEPIEKETTTEETTTPINNTVGSTNKKNGGNLKSRNGSIVKSYKNI